MRQLYFLLVFFLAFKVNGQNLALDTTFGNNGVTIVPENSESRVPIAVLFENNKYYLISLSNSITCINYNGSLDTTFGNMGKLILNEDNLNDNYIIKGVKFTNEYLYVFGQKTNSYTSNKDGFVVKITMNGIYDANFGINGKTIFNFGENEEEFNDIVINEFDEIFVAGTRASKVILTKLNSNGTLDNSFDINGYKIYTLNSTEYYNIVNLYINNQELLFIGGSTGGALKKLILFKVQINGNPITSFGNNGLKTAQLSGQGEFSGYTVEKSILDTNNELYFSCYWSYSFSSQEKRLYKYNLNTDVLNQVTTLPLYYSHFTLDANNDIFTTGTYRCSPATSSNCPRNYQIFKKDSNGNIDTNFNSTGSFSYNFFPSDLISDDKSSSFYLHNDGKILLAGYVYNPYTLNGTGIGLVRLSESSLSIEQEVKNQIIVYPNPVSNMILLKKPNDEIINKAIIYNTLGQKILEFNTNVSEINIEELQSGLYSIELQIKDKKYIKNFVKN